MARRGGKAASRRARQQRRAQESRSSHAPQQAAAQPASTEPTTAPAAETAPEPAVDAFEVADAELRASTPPPGVRGSATPPRRNVRARTNAVLTSGSSRLSTQAAAEYHYVARDLRNIGVLLVVMVILLAVAAVLVNVLGVGASA